MKTSLAILSISMVVTVSGCCGIGDYTGDPFHIVAPATPITVTVGEQIGIVITVVGNGNRIVSLDIDSVLDISVQAPEAITLNNKVTIYLTVVNSNEDTILVDIICSENEGYSAIASIILLVKPTSPPK